MFMCDVFLRVKFLYPIMFVTGMIEIVMEVAFVFLLDVILHSIQGPT